MEEYVLFWFRRDLRIADNHGLYQALTSGYKVIPLFIFDSDILEKFPDKSNKQVGFIINSVRQLELEIQKLGSSLFIFHQNPQKAIEFLTDQYSIKGLYFNEDYEPDAIKRDTQIENYLKSKSILTFKYCDQVIHRPGTVLKSDGKPYTIFTPFSKQWKNTLTTNSFTPFPSEQLIENFAPIRNPELFDYHQLGYNFSNEKSTFLLSEEVIRTYHLTRDIPALENGTSRIGAHLRFGTVSIRAIASIASQLNETFLNELIWREFFMHILHHFPHVQHQSFKPQYDAIEWRNNEDEFYAWCEGRTGIPLVDAGMRELNQSGFMHNRVRMVAASYLVKHLLIDWRWGEAYFAQKLFDFELAANNGNWQWAAGSGCDAAPYFRIFNPYRQQERFDSTFDYIKHWVPEYQSETYQKLLKTDLNEAKSRCLIAYKKALTL